MLKSNILKTKKRRALQPLFNALEQTVAPYLFGGVLLAVSGGPDSKILLECMARWQKRVLGRVFIVCCDHQTRPESQAEAVAVVARAKVLGFEAKFVKLELGCKYDEASLRKLRYEALWQVAKKQGLAGICTGHHADDSAEGYLLDLFGFGGGVSGSSIAKLTQMPDGILLRPFADISRRDLLLALSSLEFIDYFEDPLDLQQICQRATIRHSVLPALRVTHNRIDQRLFNQAQKRSAEEEVLEGLCEKTAQKCVKVKNCTATIVELDGVPRGIAKRMLKRSLAQLFKEKDLRNADKIIEKMLDSLDQNRHLSTLKTRKKRTFNLSQATAIIEKNQVVIRKRAL